MKIQDSKADVLNNKQRIEPVHYTTAQRDALTNVPKGRIIFNTSTNKLNVYNGTAWEAITSV